MLGSMYSAITGLNAASTGMDAIGNNIANVNTTAFKAARAHFASIFSDSVSILGGSPGNEEGKGVQTVAISSDWGQGAMNSTMNQEDLAIDGAGFFGLNDGVVADTATHYTRSGHFGWDGTGMLANTDGFIVQGFVYTAAGATDTIDLTNIDDIDVSVTGYPDGAGNALTDIQMGPDGVISGYDSDLTRRRDMYKVVVYNFSDIDSLTKISGSLYEDTTESGAPVAYESGDSGVGAIKYNHLEMSNVDLASEFVNLIVTQKAFQANSRVISSSSEMLQEVINIVR